MSPFYRRVLKISRLTHLYLTLFGLVLILLFAISGFLLNHIGDYVKEDQVGRDDPAKVINMEKLLEQKLPQPKRVKPNDPDDTSLTSEPTEEEKFKLVEAVRKQFNVSGEFISCQFVTDSVKTPTEADPEATKETELIKMEFLRAGGEVTVRIDRATGSTVVNRRHNGWVSVLTDLHRGNRGADCDGGETNGFGGRRQRVGSVWPWVIDFTAFLMLVIAITGLILWSSLKTRGKSGAVFLLVGTVVAFLIFLIWVP